MDYFYVSDIGNKKTIILDSGLTHHCVNVLRIKRGTFINLVDGMGTLYHATVSKVTKNTLECRITGRNYFPRPEPRINLYVPVIKQGLFEFLLEKTVELGVDNIFPVYFRSTKNIGFQKKIERLEKKLIKAFQVSRRLYKPVLYKPENLKSIITGKNLNGIVFHNHSEIWFEKQIVDKMLKRKGNLDIFIGPEGGFSNDEIAEFQKRRYPIVKVSDYNLRVETAAVYTLCLMNHWFRH